MATSTQLARTQLVTRDGVVTATLLDRVSVDRVMLMLARGSAAAVYARAMDETPLVPRDVKDAVVFPGRED